MLILNLPNYPVEVGPIRSISPIGKLRHRKASLPKFKQLVNSRARIQIRQCSVAFNPYPVLPDTVR